MPRKISPKVTVIIPCYNREDFIVQTVESVLDQTYPNIELIVVDDGCTDSSRQILEGYDKRIILLNHPGRANKGQSAAINLGLRKASGEYVAILDSDDLFAFEKIEKQVAFLECHPEVGLVYSNGHAIDEKGERLYRFYRPSHDEPSDPNRVLLDCYFLMPNNSLVRRKVLEEAGEFDESLRSGQDHDMAIRISEVARLAFFDEDLFYYRRHPNSISFKNAKLRWKNGFRILRKAIGRYPYRWSTIRRRSAVLCFRLGQCFLEERRYVAAGGNFLAAGLLDPFRSLKVLAGRERAGSPH